jgi:hypothetical protein
MISELYEKHPKAKLIVYTDEEWVVKTINQYNGVEGKAHGFYDYASIEHKPTPRVSSATELRAAVQAGDREAFTRAAGIDADTEISGKAYFDLVAEYLLPYGDKAKKKTKEDQSAVIAHTAKDLANPDSAKVMKHRAKRDQEREKTYQAAQKKRDDSSKDEWGDYKNEEAAGVGIITKQNTTKDVNKGTLRKMMKGYRLI